MEISRWRNHRTYPDADMAAYFAYWRLKGAEEKRERNCGGIYEYPKHDDED